MKIISETLVNEVFHISHMSVQPVIHEGAGITRTEAGQIMKGTRTENSWNGYNLIDNLLPVILSLYIYHEKQEPNL